MSSPLGASYLLTGRTDEGIATLQQVVELGESPFLDEAHLLLAKAFLRKGDRDRGSRELRATIALHGDTEREARDLLERLSAGR